MNQVSKDAPKTPDNHTRETFRSFAHATSEIVGSAWSFLIALLIIVVWATTGPLFHYSDTWQLIINTGTTIVTFLIVFLIQNTQNRDAKAFHLKLDELIRAVKGARNELVNLEEMSDEDLRKLQEQFERIHKHSQSHAERKVASDIEADVEEKLEERDAQ